MAVLWFHPAVWCADRTHPACARAGGGRGRRSQLTDSRERYVESLLAVARARLFPSFSPASPFLRRHLLKKRVARILQESTMTTRKTDRVTHRQRSRAGSRRDLRGPVVPARSPGSDAASIRRAHSTVQGGEHLLHGERPEYPRRAIEQKVEGDVQVEMTLNERGEVSDARVLSGPEELRKATLESVLQWHYSPGALASTVTQATLRFHSTSRRLRGGEEGGARGAHPLAAQARVRRARRAPPERDRGGARRSGHDDRQAGRVEDDGREDPRGAGSVLRKTGRRDLCVRGHQECRNWENSKDRLDSCRCEPSVCQRRRRKKS